MTRTHAPRRRRGRRATALATLAIASLGLVAGLAPAAVAQQSDTQTQEGHGPRGPRLTDEQKACLEEQGIEKPATDENGKRVKPTEEQREQFEAAAQACGIDLPERPAGGGDQAPSDTPADGGDTST